VVKTNVMVATDDGDGGSELERAEAFVLLEGAERFGTEYVMKCDAEHSALLERHAGGK
jgi:hypothetical protein